MLDRQAASAASALLVAPHSQEPTDRALSSDATLLATADSSTGTCRRFTLTAHRTLTQLLGVLEIYLFLAHDRPGLQLVHSAVLLELDPDQGQPLQAEQPRAVLADELWIL